MLWLIRLLTPLFGKIAAAPILEIVEKLVADADLKEKLKAEIACKLVERDQTLIAARQSVILAEQNSESWITRSWRPMLMLLIMGFLLFFGLIVPLIELGLGRPIPVEPRLDRIPEPAWNLLTLGLGGYVGGRTIEKMVSSWLARARRPAETARQGAPLRRKR
jgi:holin (3TMs family)